jgi:hypothetical protein
MLLQGLPLVLSQGCGDGQRPNQRDCPGGPQRQRGPDVNKMFVFYLFPFNFPK